MEPKRITVKIKEAHSLRHVYPVCDAAHHFAAIARQDTLTQNTLEHIRGLGYEIVVQTPALPKL